MRRRQRCTVYVTDVCPPISFDDSNHAARRLLRGTSWGSAALLLCCPLFSEECFIFTLAFRVFGIVIL